MSSRSAAIVLFTTLFPMPCAMIDTQQALRYPCPSSLKENGPTCYQCCSEEQIEQISQSVGPTSGQCGPGLDHSLKICVFFKQAWSRGKGRGSLRVGRGLPCWGIHKGSLVWEWWRDALWETAGPRAARPGLSWAGHSATGSPLRAFSSESQLPLGLLASSPVS